MFDHGGFFRKYTHSHNTHTRTQTLPRLRGESEGRIMRVFARPLLLDRHGTVLPSEAVVCERSWVAGRSRSPERKPSG